jgi:Ig-like domain-containing protein
MTILRLCSGRFFRSRILFAISLILLSLSAFACSPKSTPTPFRPPTIEPPLIEPTLIIRPTKKVVVVQSTPVPTITAFPTADQQDCTNELRFVEDVTVPDNSFITYGASIDKQWLVENGGTCNWDSNYRLKHLGGADLGAPEELMLYPARAGTRATLRVMFSAPYTDGVYESAWQAVDPSGNVFGDTIYIRITVASQ